jgi:hypothetical protein
MSSTDTAITVHPEMSIDPKAVISHEAIQAAPAEAKRKGREFACYKVPAASMSGDYTVTYNSKTRTLYCSCMAGQHGTPCKHLASVLFLREYERAYREYYDLSLPELAARQRDFTEMERRTLVPVRGWRAQNAAIADLVWERTEGIA